VDEGHGRNHQVHVGNRYALCERLALDLAELTGAGLIEVENRDLREQVGNKSQKAVGVGVLVRSRVKF